MKKKYICFCLATFLLGFSACTPTENSSVDGTNSEIFSSSEGLAPSTLLFPEIVEFPTIDLGFDPQDKISEKIELNYEVTSPDDRFFHMLEDMDEESYKYLLDQKNYFKIGDYTLFYSNFSFVGPSKIYLDTSNEETSEVFSSTQPILEMSFSPNTTTIFLEMSEVVYFDGDDSIYYELDLKKGTLNVAEIGENNIAESTDTSLYYGQYYLRLWDMETGDGSLMRRNINGDHEEIIGNMQVGPVFANGNVYYSKPDDSRIYYRILYNGEHQKDIMLSDNIQRGVDSFFVCDNKIIYNRSENVEQSDIVVVDITSKKVLATLNAFSMGSIINFSPELVYYLDKENTLQFCDYTGKTAPIFANVDNVQINMISDEWVYFSHFEKVENRGWLHGKVRLDGTDLTFFT